MSKILEKIFVRNFDLILFFYSFYYAGHWLWV